VNGSEDCLYLGLYSRPWTSSQPLRPVVVVFYGGAFIQGSASFTLPPSAYPVLNVSDAGDGMIFVYPNYRVNAFGFLAGRQVAADPGSDANAGLLDQHAALLWTRRHIRAFGGDSDQVTIWGQSAGGGSVLAQVISSSSSRDTSGGRYRRHGSGGGGDDGRTGGQSQSLFRSALASSPFWPKTYAHDAAETQAHYDTLANLTGCAAAADSLRCLKSVDVAALRNASYTMVSGNLYGANSYPWSPVIDGVFLTRTLSEATAHSGSGSGSGINNRLGFSMYNTHEGENFVPGALSSTLSYDDWAAAFLPGFGGDELARLAALYPAAGSAESLAAYNDSFTRAGLVYRDSVLACPAYWAAGAAPAGGWLGEYTIAPAKHASDVAYVSGQKNYALRVFCFLCLFFFSLFPNVPVRHFSPRNHHGHVKLTPVGCFEFIYV
jgi:carboxylesterase type B